MYYLYRHIRLDKNEVFYIGIGTKSFKFKALQSMYRRAYEKTKSRSIHWKNIISKTPYIVEILFETENLDLIQQKEIEFITLYKKTLCNLTDGGFGISSYNHTEDAKLRISKSTKGVKKSESHVHNINKVKLKPIVMYNSEINKTFNSLTEAALYVGNIKYQKNISAAALGKRPSAYGYKFKYIENVESSDKEH